MTVTEPPQPQRGQTLDERQPPQPAARRSNPGSWSEFRDDIRTAHPRTMLALGDGFPVVIKHLIQGFFLLVWPFWAVGVLVVSVLYHFVFFPILYALFWPIRVIFKDRNSADATPPSA